MIDPTSKDDPKFKDLVKVRREGAELWAGRGASVLRFEAVRGGGWREEGVKVQVTTWTPPRCPFTGAFLSRTFCRVNPHRGYFPIDS